ncbi:MAG: winged helix-turn-helix domain-containing protein [Desulfurococcaceae archaeon]|jgi:predicted transcriptional regulator|nr:winged helix-turn-helix domain-containing protein [Desulfurococcaceae archaeon]
MKKRSRLELIMEILEAINSEEGINPTWLSIKVNLSYDRVKKILDYLIARGLVESLPSDERKGFTKLVLTTKGMELVKELRKMKSLLRDYGLL